jgi:radical SAM superfamily enzyme YgiQ (UPF0313 family)
MKIRKIVMVEPSTLVPHIYSRYLLPRLGLPILGTLAKRRGIQVRIYIEDLVPTDFNDVATADLLCLSSITPTIPAAYQIADRARAAGVPVILGGPHATFMADEGLDHADWVLRGEGERSFMRFLDMLEGRANPEEVPGLSYRTNEQTFHNQLESEPVSMDEVPIPDFSLLVGKQEDKFHRGVIPIQSSRGCPHKCHFCSVTRMFGRKMRFASHEHVAAELESRRGQGRRLFFYDDNFCAPPSRAKSLLDFLMTKNAYLPRWTTQVSVRAAKDLELLKLMQRSRCHTVFVGFESISEESLSLYKKRQAIDDIKLAVRRFHDHDIRIHGMFITGADTEDLQNIQETARFVIEQDIETVQFLILTPLPGTPLFQEMERDGRLLTKDWSLYDAHHAVFKPAKSSAYDLMDQTFAGMAKVYSARQVLRMAARGEFRRVALNLYGAAQVRRWRRLNRKLMKEAGREARQWKPSLNPSVPGISSES